MVSLADTRPRQYTLKAQVNGQTYSGGGGLWFWSETKVKAPVLCNPNRVMDPIEQPASHQLTPYPDVYMTC